MRLFVCRPLAVRARVALLITSCAVATTAAPIETTDKPLKARLADLEGNKVALEDLRGGPVLLELWASWCLPCREQAKVIASLAEVFEKRGVTVYAVNVGEEEEKVEEHLLRESFVNPVLLDQRQIISTRLKIEELPALVLLAADGQVAGTAVGLTGREEVLSMLERVRVRAAAGDPPSASNRSDGTNPLTESDRD